MIINQKSSNDVYIINDECLLIKSDIKSNEMNKAKSLKTIKDNSWMYIVDFERINTKTSNIMKQEHKLKKKLGKLERKKKFVKRFIKEHGLNMVDVEVNLDEKDNIKQIMNDSLINESYDKYKDKLIENDKLFIKRRNFKTNFGKDFIFMNRGMDILQIIPLDIAIKNNQGLNDINFIKLIKIRMQLIKYL